MVSFCIAQSHWSLETSQKSMFLERDCHVVRLAAQNIRVRKVFLNEIMPHGIISASALETGKLEPCLNISCSANSFILSWSIHALNSTQKQHFGFVQGLDALVKIEGRGAATRNLATCWNTLTRSLEEQWNNRAAQNVHGDPQDRI